jgi:flagellar FliJ protein
MKKFSFRYDKILQVRIDKENEVKNKLGKINMLIHEKESELTSVIDQNKSFLEDVNSAMSEGILASDMQAIRYNKEFLKNKIDSVSHELQVLKAEQKRVQNELIEANKQRKVMEKLKEKELENYKELEAQEESKMVDQIVTYQSTKTRGEE